MITMPRLRLTRGYARHAMLCCAALAAVTWVTEAAGQAIPAGAPVTARGSIICDTAEQVIEILSASARDGAQAGRAVFRRYLEARNAHGAPVCVIGEGAVMWTLKSVVTQVDDVPVGAGTQTFFASSLRPVGPEVPNGDPA